MARRAAGGPKKKLRRGLWSPEEDEKLMNHIAKYGHGCWSSVPKLAGNTTATMHAGLETPKINFFFPSIEFCYGKLWSQIAAQLPGRTDNEVKNLWNSYIKKKLRQRGIDPATHKPLLVEAATATSTAAATSSRSAVFIDAELILSSAAAGHQHMPQSYNNNMYSGHSIVSGGDDGSLSLSGYNNATAADLAAGGYQLDPDTTLPCGPPAAVVLPSVSSSSTLNSMAGLSPAATTTTTTTTTDEHCCNNISNNGFESSCSEQHLPWLELGTTTGSCGAAMDEYGAALDELKWSDYVFDGYQQQTGGHQYQFDAHGLGSSSTWCLN
ncbi:hypothetical protein PR202_gb21789 [Eleusine coracana subsp. coracana]|uniref:Uncharacterized protein n=1 Tax=Eleusine coracana subsp. coracana TaxID=191504 RepID=A0AAV5FEJ4_ELECO|nr:hypothetical protein PR202_gb21789 [Eleusine coracana subsp. coracana]